MRTLTEPATLDLDRTLCAIESLGRILTALSLAESTEIDLHWLADLGRVISQQAMNALDIVTETHPAADA